MHGLFLLLLIAASRVAATLAPATSTSAASTSRDDADESCIETCSSQAATSSNCTNSSGEVDIVDCICTNEDFRAAITACAKSTCSAAAQNSIQLALTSGCETTSSPAPTATETKKRVPIAAIAGGAIGGVVVAGIIAAVAIFLCCKKRKSRTRKRPPPLSTTTQQYAMSPLAARAPYQPLLEPGSPVPGRRNNGTPEPYNTPAPSFQQLQQSAYATSAPPSTYAPYSGVSPPPSPRPSDPDHAPSFAAFPTTFPQTQLENLGEKPPYPPHGYLPQTTQQYSS